MSALKKRYYQKINEEIYSATLDNGLSLSIIKKKGFLEKAAFLSINFGSIDNCYYLDGELQTYPAGIAHFLEHKLFEDEQGKDVTLDFVKLGADVNAFTTLDRTTYYFSTLDNFEEALGLLLKFTSGFTSSEKSVNHEKKIIEQEINMYQDDPDYRAYLGCLQNLYPNTILGQDIAGNNESIEKITVEDLKNNFDCFYRPENCHLVLVGDFDVDDVYTFVNERQRRLTELKTIVEKEKKLIEAEIKKRDNLQMEVSIAKLAVGFKSATFSDSRMRENLLVQLLFNLLFGWTSPYYQNWYSEGKIDESVSIEYEVSNRYSFVIITMDTVEPIKMSSLIRQVMTSADKKRLLTEEALDLQKKALYGEFLRSLDNIQGLGNQYLAFLDNDKTYFDLGQELMSITSKELKDFLNHYLSNMVITDFVVFPK